MQQNLKELGQQLDKVNQTITQARLERDMLEAELKKKAQAYQEATGEALPSTLKEVEVLRKMVEQQLKSTITFLENAVSLFNAQEYEALSRAMGIEPKSEIAEVIEDASKTGVDMPTQGKTVETKSQMAQEPAGSIGALNLNMETPAPANVVGDLNLDLGKPTPKKPASNAPAGSLSQPVIVPDFTQQVPTSIPVMEGLDLNLGTQAPVEPIKKQEAPVSEPAVEGLGLNLNLNLNLDTPAPTKKQEAPVSAPALEGLNLDLGVPPVQNVASDQKSPLLTSKFDSEAFESLLDTGDDYELPLDEDEDSLI